MKGCIAVLGAGGKTTAVRSLAHRLCGFSVLWTTTTHIYPAAPEDCRLRLASPTAAQLSAALAAPGVVCAGVPAGEKWTALPPEVFAAGCRAADYIVCEADGAHRLPLKLHRPDEPVLPAETTRALIVVGLSALGRPVEEVVHRYTLHPAWAAAPRTPVGVEELCFCAGKPPPGVPCRKKTSACCSTRRMTKCISKPDGRPPRRLPGRDSAAGWGPCKKRTLFWPPGCWAGDFAREMCYTC